MRSTRQHLAILLLVGACTAQSGGAAADPALDPTRFEPEIRAFEAADRASPPSLGGVVFIGSSSIQHWSDVAADFPGVPILNRGFGGSTLTDVVSYEDRNLLPYHPHLVVLYAAFVHQAEPLAPGLRRSDAGDEPTDPGGNSAR